MTRIELLQEAKDRGYSCNFKTGSVYGIHGRLLMNVTGGYKSFTIDKQTIKQHHFIWFMYHGRDVLEDKVIDHINRNPLDNRIENLREVSQHENVFNNSSKGYYWNKKAKKWYVGITLNGKYIYLGVYENEQDAINTRLEAKKKYHIIND